MKKVGKIVIAGIVLVMIAEELHNSRLEEARAHARGIETDYSYLYREPKILKSLKTIQNLYTEAYQQACKLETKGDYAHGYHWEMEDLGARYTDAYYSR
jgi:hypothetical protein